MHIGVVVNTNQRKNKKLDINEEAKASFFNIKIPVQQGKMLGKE